MLFLPDMRAQISFALSINRAVARYRKLLIPTLEHLAIQEQDVVDPHKTFKDQGYSLNTLAGQVSFFGKPYAVTIEVVPNTTPRHVGYLFSELEDLEQMATILTESTEWTLTSSSTDSTFVKWFMFEYNSTGNHFQIIWRQNPLFGWDD